MQRFTDKVAIVTGAGNGIGLAIAHALAAAGAHVVVAEINAAAGRRAADELVAAGRQAIAIPTDVADEQQVAHGRGRRRSVRPGRYPGQQRRRRGA